MTESNVYSFLTGEPIEPELAVQPQMAGVETIIDMLNQQVHQIRHIVLVMEMRDGQFRYTHSVMLNTTFDELVQFLFDIAMDNEQEE